MVIIFVLCTLNGGLILVSQWELKVIVMTSAYEGISCNKCLYEITSEKAEFLHSSVNCHSWSFVELLEEDNLIIFLPEIIYKKVD